MLKRNERIFKVTSSEFDAMMTQLESLRKEYEDYRLIMEKKEAEGREYDSFYLIIQKMLLCVLVTDIFSKMRKLSLPVFLYIP